MIINLRGTNGSGKSTIVRQVMDYYYQPPSQLMVADRKRPIGYILKQEGVRDLMVPGHYETACGGCDTIKTPAQAFEHVAEAAGDGMDVLFEGIMVQDDVTRTVALDHSFPLQVMVLYLDLPIEQCLEGVRARRAARGDVRPLKEDNTRNRAKRLVNVIRRLEDAGVRVCRCPDRETALGIALKMFGVKP